MNTKILSRVALIALPLAFVGCKGKAPDSRSSRPVLVAELRVPYVGPDAALVATVTDLADGHSGTNPPGTVEVFSEGGVSPQEYVDQVGNPCGARAVYVPVVVKSYATETLTDAMIEFTSMEPISHTVCNDQTGKLSGVAGQVVKYGTLTGSAASNGSAAGGQQTVTWSMNYTTAEPFSFIAKVWADVTPAPPTGATNRSVYCPGGGCGVAIPVDPVLSWTGSTPQAYVAVSASPTFATTIEGANISFTTNNGDGTYAFEYTVTNATAGQRYWRAYSRFAGTGGTVNGTFYTGGSYLVDGPPTNQKLYAWDNVAHDPLLACTFAASDFNTQHEYAPYPSADAPWPYNWVVMYAETAAPQIELWTWGWWESWNGYFPHTRANPFIHHRTCGDITAGWLGGPAGTPSPGYAALFREPQVNTIDPDLAATVFGVMFCNQYGTLEDPLTLGTCTTTVYSGNGWDYPVAPYPNFTPSQAPVDGVYPAGTTVTITGGAGWSDPLYAPVQFYYTLDGTEPTTSSTHYTGPITLPTGTSQTTTTITAMSAGDGFYNSYAPRNATFTTAAVP